MKIGIATDHGGFALKEVLVAHLRKQGYEIEDFGAHVYDAEDDFPDFVIPLAQAVGRGEIAKGIAVCGSGVGACIAANKVKGVRASVIMDHYSAHQGVEHDEMNMICLGGRLLGVAIAMEITDAFLKATYQGAERQKRRMAKIAALENGER